MVKDYGLKVLNELKPIDSLHHLIKHLRGDERQYVKTIATLLPAILETQPWEYDNLHQSYFSCFDRGGTSAVNLSRIATLKTSSGKTETKPLYMHIVSALQYDEVQGKVFPEYVAKLGIRSCVYCNAQYAVSSKKGKTDRSSTYRTTYNLDHWWPKNQYPYLAVAFYNLYPCCAACNQRKSSTIKDWCLYAKEGEELNPYKFRVDDMSLLNYMLSWDAEKLKIELVDKFSNGTPQYDNDFHIRKLYSNFKSEVEDVIWRKRIYSQKMIEAMQQSGVYDLKPRDVNRFIIGNYNREEDIMKRPLAKLIQDIAKQMGLM